MASATFLIGRFKEGHSSAFDDLLGLYYAYPVDLARRRLSRGRPMPEDGEDIAQLVFWELYRSVRQGRPLGDGLSDTASLLKTLALLTRQHVRREWRHHTRHCRDVRKSRLATDLVARTGDTDPLDAPATHATAFVWLRDIESQESIEQLLVLLPSAKHRTLVQLVLQGYSGPEIARELGCSVRTVQRYLLEIQAIWQRHREAQDVVPPCG